jgi:hydrogenase-1 operon protein HyaF
MSLENISIKVETAGVFSVGNVNALLSEIAAGLAKIIATGETTVIDLQSLPFAPGEYEQLRQTLGQGEVTARIEAIGTSEVIETRCPGVWWLTHCNIEGDIVADVIEITSIPEMLKSQPEDVCAGLDRLNAMLSQPAPRND